MAATRPLTLHGPSAGDPVLADWGAFAEEFGRLDDVEVVTLGSGHWPQFSQPDRLARHLVAAIR